MAAPQRGASRYGSALTTQPAAMPADAASGAARRQSTGSVAATFRTPNAPWPSSPSPISSAKPESTAHSATSARPMPCRRSASMARS